MQDEKDQYGNSLNTGRVGTTKIKHYVYCSIHTELGKKCSRQCTYCRDYFKPLELNNKRLPRKLKKKLKKRKFIYFDFETGGLDNKLIWNCK